MNQALRVLPGMLHPWRFIFRVLAIWGLTGRTTQAQVDVYQFAASQGAYTELPAAAPAVPALLADDEKSGALPLGFSFVFDGTAYTTAYASSNGFLSFNSAVTSSFSNSLATTIASNRPLLAPLWDDLDGRPTGATAVAAYQTTGTAPNRVFTFEWRNWEWDFSAGVAVVSFQVKLYETANRVEFVYRPEAGMPANASASIGLAGAGMSGLFLSLNNTGASPTASSTTETSTLSTVPAAGQVYAFTPASNTCPTPRNLTATALTATSATLSWSVSGGGGTFSVNYGPTGFTPGTGGQTLSTTATSINLTGLTASTEYQFYVTQVCAGSSSTRSSAATFRTACVAPVYASLPFAETFENEWLSRCNTREVPSNSWRNTPTTGNASWRREDDATGGGWTSPTSGLYSPAGSQGSAHSARFHSYSATSVSVGTLDLFVNLSGSGSRELNFDYININGSDSLAVQVSTDGGATFGPLLLRLGVSATFQPQALTLTSTSATTVIRFRARADFGTTDIGLDNVAVASCPRPSNVVVSNVTASSATVAFTPVAGVSSYTVVATPASGPPVTVTPTPTGSPVQLTGLQGLTEYTVSVVSNCGANQTSAPATATFTTLLPPSVNDEPCEAVALAVGTGGSFQTTSSTTLGATGTVPNGYSNPGCAVASNPRDVWFRVVIPSGGSTSLTLTAAGNAAGQVRVFAAASCNGPFTQLSCKAGAGPGTAAGAQVVTGLTSGATYYVSVSGYSSSEPGGAFTLQAGQGVLASRSGPPSGEVSVYPNPNSTGQLTLRIAGAPAGLAHATLFNALGQLVLSEDVRVQAGAATQPLAVRHLAKGVYTLRVEVDGALVMRKVVLE